MSSSMRLAMTASPNDTVDCNHQDYISLIHHAMAERNIGQRKLAVKSGISKTRLGVILHRNPAKRATVSLEDLRRILNALDINVVQAVISVESGHDHRLLHDARFATSVAMLTDLIKELPANLFAALEEIEGLDGTEVRREWAGPLRQAVVDKLVKEISAVMARRAIMTQFSNLGF